MWEWIAVILIIIFSSLVQGLLGFGFGIVAIPLMPLFIGFGNAVSLMAILIAIAMIFLFFQTKRQFSWRDSRVLLVGALCGLPVGVTLIVFVEEALMLQCFGGLMILISFHHFAFQQRGSAEIHDSLAYPCGFCSGLLAGAFNMGGPPMVAYLYSKPWPLDKIKSILATSYLIVALSRTPFVGFTSEDLGLVILLAVLSILPIAIFITLGIKLGHRVGSRKLKTLVYLFLGMMGCYYLFLHQT